MTNKEKYEGKTVQFYAPRGGRALQRVKVTKVLEDNVLCGIIIGTDIETAYYLSDGIGAVIVEKKEPIKVDEIKKGDTFNVVTNGTSIRIMEVSVEEGKLIGFMVEQLSEEGKHMGIAPLSVEYFVEKIDCFEPIGE